MGNILTAVPLEPGRTDLDTAQGGGRSGSERREESDASVTSSSAALSEVHSKPSGRPTQVGGFTVVRMATTRP